MNEFPAWANTPTLRLEYILRLAALHHKRGGTLYTLSIALHRNRSYLRTILQRGQMLTAEDAAAVENLVGRGVAPREILAPVPYAGWTPAA